MLGQGQVRSSATAIDIIATLGIHTSLQTTSKPRQAHPRSRRFHYPPGPPPSILCRPITWPLQ
jgi:hypothetical protein